MAIGACIGLSHQYQGFDLADTIVAKLRGIPPTPSLAHGAGMSLGEPSVGITHQVKHPLLCIAGSHYDRCFLHDSSHQKLSSTIKVNAYANGESTPAGDVILSPAAIRTMGDMRRATGAVIDGCETGQCRVFNELGRELESLTSLKDEQKIWLVAPRRHFVWPAFEVGHKVR